MTVTVYTSNKVSTSGRVKGCLQDDLPSSELVFYIGQSNPFREILAQEEIWTRDKGEDKSGQASEHFLEIRAGSLPRPRLFEVVFVLIFPVLK